MPRPFTGPKIFCAGPNFLSQPKNLTAFSAFFRVGNYFDKEELKKLKITFFFFKLQVRSLSANLKFPYKRTVSAPGGMGLSAKASNASVPPNLGNLVVNRADHAFTSSSRQISAPILKNKTSRIDHSLRYHTYIT